MQSDPENALTAELHAAWCLRLSQALNLLMAAWFLEFMLGRWQARLGGPDWPWALLGMILAGLEFAGFWLFTTPPTGSPERGRVARQMIRWLAVAMVLFALVDGAGAATGRWTGDASVPYAIPAMAMHVAVFAAYLCSVARRIDRPTFVWQTLTAFGGLVIGLTGFTACLPWLSVLEEPQIPQGVLLAAVVVSFSAVVIFGIWSVVMVFRYHKALLTASKSNHARESAPSL